MNTEPPLVTLQVPPTGLVLAPLELMNFEPAPSTLTRLLRLFAQQNRRPMAKVLPLWMFSTLFDVVPPPPCHDPPAAPQLNGLPKPVLP